MARSQVRSQRKASGGRYHAYRAKKKYELSGYPANAKIDTEHKSRVKRTLGGNSKRVLLGTNKVNVTNAQGKTQKTELVNVVENSANPNLVRRNILTKGAVVETKLGRARITSRPGQTGTANAVLV
ncbi:30S ribosomal protein S8e [Candidatus Woesearchaeota archaeon CG10_big_fil_rev_8_21_14_0_10_36_11]|nr:MAG: 30S ribosomal protein S8e [Candidatus Woesearchaeota archaeon CG10_big_fil_rev_8_21_14_0_10_36_11]